MAEQNNLKKKTNLDEIRYTEVFTVADAKTTDAKIPSNSDLVK